MGFFVCFFGTGPADHKGLGTYEPNRARDGLLGKVAEKDPLTVPEPNLDLLMWTKDCSWPPPCFCAVFSSVSVRGVVAYLNTTFSTDN